jgi:hypothetical protein
MQFSFNFLSGDGEPIPSIQETTEDIADVSSDDTSRVIDIPCPSLSVARIRAHSSTLALQSSNGAYFNLLRVQEQNPEKEYDLIPGKYEGGSKIWECSLDLVQHILNRFDPQNKNELGSVLELGCGMSLSHFGIITCMIYF